MGQSKRTAQAMQYMQQVLTNEEFNDYLHQAYLWAADLAKGETDVQTYLFGVELLDDDEEKGVMFMPLLVSYQNDAEKEALMKAIGANLAAGKHKTLAIFMISEGWVSKRSEGDVYIEPRLDPNRSEAVFVSGLTMDGRSNYAAIFLERDNDNKFVDAGRLYEPYGKEGGARVTPNRMLRWFWAGFADASLGRLARLN